MSTTPETSAPTPASASPASTSPASTPSRTAPSGTEPAPTYPPEPWTLVGRMRGSAFGVPADDVPAEWPAGTEPLRVAGRVPVGAVWVDYAPGGHLSYRELLVAALARRGRAVVPHVVRIWVDSPASRDGGRELWGIPKGLADFTGDPDLSCTPEGADRPAARAVVRTGPRLPVRLPIGFTVVQTLAGATLASPVATRAAPGTASAQWDVDPHGDLAFLAGRRPVASFALHDFSMLFGLTPTDRARQAERARGRR